MAITLNITNGIIFLEFLLAKELVRLDQNLYCNLTATRTQQLVWNDKKEHLSKAIILLVNSQNEAAKKDLGLAYALGNQTVYPKRYGENSRFLLSQYTTKKNNNPNNCNKKGDKNKQDDNTQPEDNKNDNITTAGVHVAEATSDKLKTGASIDSSRSSVHVYDITKIVVKPTQYVRDILAVYPLHDP